MCLWHKLEAVVEAMVVVVEVVEEAVPKDSAWGSEWKRISRWER